MEKLKSLIRQSGKSSKAVYNELLRAALCRPAAKTKTPDKLKLKVFKGKGGLMPGFSWDMTTSQMLDKLDEADWEKKKP